MRKLFDHPLPFFAAIALTTAALAFGVADLSGDTTRTVVRLSLSPMTSAITAAAPLRPTPLR